MIFYHHLGLGDHIIMNGAVRYLCEKKEDVDIFCKPHNLQSVSFMFRDLRNLNIIQGDDSFAQNYCDQNSHLDSLKVGFENLHFTDKSFDEAFYNQMGIPFEYRWSKFHIERDLEREIFLLCNLIPISHRHNYIFVHDDESRGYKINIEGENVIRPNKELTTNIFDYIKTLENAREIHVMDSSFKHIVDSISPKGKLFYHTYVRGNSKFFRSKSKLNWKVLGKPDG